MMSAITNFFSKNIKKGLSYFALGTLADFLVVIYYRSVMWKFGSLSFFSAMVTAYILAVLPMLVVEKGIITKSRWIFHLYAAGCALGTYIGMNVRI